MAKTPESVYALLDQLWKPRSTVAKQEAAELQAMIDAEKGGFKLEPWDWRYYSEKVKKAKYDLDEEAIKPYFPLDQVRQGAFTLAGQALRHHLHRAQGPARLPRARCRPSR